MGVHPDKNPAPEARRAFDALKEAHKLLQDGASRREYEQQEGDKLLQKLAAEALYGPGAAVVSPTYW